MGEESFEPKIVGFFCKWCTATAADLAGVTRLEYPPNIRPIRVMCSGSVDMAYVLRALLSGADAVWIGGCHPGDCHYKEGNYKALRRYRLLKKLQSEFGIEDERIRLEWISASEGGKFQQVCNEFTETIRKLGPFNSNKGGKNE